MCTIVLNVNTIKLDKKSILNTYTLLLRHFDSYYFFSNVLQTDVFRCVSISISAKFTNRHASADTPARISFSKLITMIIPAIMYQPDKIRVLFSDVLYLWWNSTLVNWRDNHCYYYQAVVAGGWWQCWGEMAPLQLVLGWKSWCWGLVLFFYMSYQLQHNDEKS